MQTVRQIAAAIVAREGGYVNDPDDPGGATNFGVTLGTLQSVGKDKDGDGQTTVRDLRALTRREAEDIFIRHYYDRPRISELPEPLRASVFDMQVNAGAQAIRLLQKLLTDMGMPCAADGVIGPQTLALARQAMQIAPDHLVNAYGIARRNYYYSLADRRPASRKYARRRDGGKGGWIARAEEFIAARYHLSAEAHALRVASWG